MIEFENEKQKRLETSRQEVLDTIVSFLIKN